MSRSLSGEMEDQDRSNTPGRNARRPDLIDQGSVELPHRSRSSNERRRRRTILPHPDRSQLESDFRARNPGLYPPEPSGSGQPSNQTPSRSSPYSRSYINNLPVFRPPPPPPRSNITTNSSNVTIEHSSSSSSGQRTAQISSGRAKLPKRKPLPTTVKRKPIPRPTPPIFGTRPSLTSSSHQITEPQESHTQNHAKDRQDAKDTLQESLRSSGTIPITNSEPNQPTAETTSLSAETDVPFEENQYQERPEPETHPVAGPPPPSPSSTPDCTICLEPLTSLCQLRPCRHQFDFHCILPWFDAIHATNLNLDALTCPLCRTVVYTIYHAYEPDGYHETFSIEEHFRGPRERTQRPRPVPNDHPRFLNRARDYWGVPRTFNDGYYNAGSRRLLGETDARRWPEDMVPGTIYSDYVSDQELDEHGLEIINSLFSEMERLEAIGEGPSNNTSLDRLLRDVRLESINRRSPQTRGILRRGNGWSYQLGRLTSGDQPVNDFDDFDTLIPNEDQAEGSNSRHRFQDAEQRRDQDYRLYAERREEASRGIWGTEQAALGNRPGVGRQRRVGLLSLNTIGENLQIEPTTRMESRINDDREGSESEGDNRDNE